MIFLTKTCFNCYIFTKLFLLIVPKNILSDIGKKEDGKKSKKVQPTLFVLGKHFEVKQIKRKPDGKQFKDGDSFIIKKNTDGALVKNFFLAKCELCKHSFLTNNALAAHKFHSQEKKAWNQKIEASTHLEEKSCILMQVGCPKEHFKINTIEKDN